jgi:haloalkane dehalogenase
VFDRHFLDEWRRRFPKAEIHSFNDCGHYILEDAREQVIPIIQDFLKAHPLKAAKA